MARMRKRFEGLRNIVMFNAHLYLWSFLGLASLLIAGLIFPAWSNLFYGICAAGFCSILFSLLAAFVVYDLSSLYTLSWLDGVISSQPRLILHLHAGLDEISEILHLKYPAAELMVADFYDPAVHTEKSIRKARKSAILFPGTLSVNVYSLPLENRCADFIILFLCAHEVRNVEEREKFFCEIKRILGQEGKIIIVEHLRDFNNFFAFNIGFFHFYSRANWDKVFYNAGLKVSSEKCISGLINVFELEARSEKII